MKQIIITGLILLVGMSSQHVVGQNLILNGDFEEGQTGLEPEIPQWQTEGTPSVAIPGGVNINGNFIIGEGTPASPTGGQFAVLRNSPASKEPLPEGVIQTLTELIPGEEYVVTLSQTNAGWVDFRPGFPNQTGPGYFVVTFAGKSQETPTMVFEGFGSQTWQTLELTFTATENSHQLRVDAAGFVPGSPPSETGRLGIDGISVSLVEDVILGDVNCDGEVNLLDVAPFVDAISSGNYNAKADCNQDGSVNLLDVDPFIAILSGG